MTDITALGEILIDLTQTGYQEQRVPQFAANPGGAPANVAVAAARLGAKTAFIGKVGADGFGAYLRQVLEENRVDAANLCTDNTHTTMAVVTIAPSGERTFRFIRGADRMLRPEDVADGALKNTKFFHFGSVSLTQEPARTATLSAVRQARSHGSLISYDPNYRASLWESHEEALLRMNAPLPLVDVLKLSEEELPLLAGTDAWEEGSRRLTQKGVSLILITLGSKGAFCRWREKTAYIPGTAVKVADTNGAGDTFLGAVLSQLCLRGEHPLQDLQMNDLKDILTFANRAAAKTCSRSGAIPAMPSLWELQAKR